MFARAGLVLGIAVALYVVCWLVDAHLRTRRGPWEVTFTRESDGEPAIVIAEPRLGISGVRIVFAGESVAATNATATVRFDRPRPELPFGRVLYDDLMYQPGAVTFDLFGHEIELLPTRLGVNRSARAWNSGEVLRLQPAEKPPPRPPGKKARGDRDSRQ
jgi:hypothetical protein